jgi:hypothetical protein
MGGLFADRPTTSHTNHCVLMRVRRRLVELGDDAQRGGWLRAAVAAVLLLNLLDAVFTLIWVHAGIATEANLLLQDLVERNAVAFALSKSLLVSLGLLLLWRQRARRLATFGIALAFVTYNALLLYHLGIAVLAVERSLA